MKSNTADASQKTTAWLPFPEQSFWFSLQEGQLCAAMTMPGGDRYGGFNIVNFSALDENGRRELTEIALFLEEHADRLDELLAEAERSFWSTIASSYPEAGVEPEQAGAACLNLGVDLKLAMRYAACDWVKHNLRARKATTGEQSSLL